MSGGPVQLSTGRAVAALVLSMLHILTILGTQYQAGTFRQLSFGFNDIVNYAIYLSPVAALWLLSFFGYAALALLGSPIVVFFVLRMLHVLEFYRHGYNSMAVQKGDSLAFFHILFFMLVLFGLALMMVLGLIALLNWYQTAVFRRGRQAAADRCQARQHE